MTASSPTRTLLVTHTLLFAMGVVVGHRLNADELSLYRSAHESNLSRWKRRAVNATLGLASLTTVVVAIRAMKAR